MQYLKLERNHGVFRPLEEGSMVEIEVLYTLGGTNFLSCSATPRGIYVSIRPVTIERSQSGSISHSYVMVGSRRESGVRVHALDLARKSERQLNRVANLIDSYAPTLARLWMEGNFDPAIQLLREALAPLKTKIA